jgi:hypothetical protein
MEALYHVRKWQKDAPGGDSVVHLYYVVILGGEAAQNNHNNSCIDQQREP